MNRVDTDRKEKNKIDWFLISIPCILIVTAAIFLGIFPEESNDILTKIKLFFGNTLGSFYILIGIAVLTVSLYISFSKYGCVVLGNQNDTPQYSFMTWGAMMFTCGLAADILFYSFAEWIMYADNPHVAEMNGGIIEWAGVFPLFHWSFIPWAFYLVMAVVFGFLLHCRKRERQRFSEACIPVIGECRAYGRTGRLIDLFALFALLAGTATTFSLATPLMAEIINTLFGIGIDRKIITIAILLITCATYTYAAIHGFKGISFLARLCVCLFFGLQLIVLFCGGESRFIIENGIQSFGKMIQEFIGLCTYMDPIRSNSFPQDWTIYYWAYWMVWCIAAPFFIGVISKGRTIRQTILGGYLFGVGSTISSFIILGNYGLGMQIEELADYVGIYEKNGDLYEVIIEIIMSLPAAPLILFITMTCMIAFYATSFDSIAYMAASYSYKKLSVNEKPNNLVVLLWCVLLIVLPIALVFSESSMNNIQSLCIVCAFPIGIIMVVMMCGFLKDCKDYMKEKGIISVEKR